jgi:hypothetical protein
MSRHIWIKAIPVAVALSFVMGAEARAAGVTYTTTVSTTYEILADGYVGGCSSTTYSGGNSLGCTQTVTGAILPSSISGSGINGTSGQGFVSSVGASGSSTGFGGGGSGALNASFTDNWTLTSSTLALGTPVIVSYTLSGNSSVAVSGDYALAQTSLNLSSNSYTVGGTQPGSGIGVYYDRYLQNFNGSLINNIGTNSQTSSGNILGFIGGRIDFIGNLVIQAGTQFGSGMCQ